MDDNKPCNHTQNMVPFRIENHCIKVHICVNVRLKVSALLAKEDTPLQTAKTEQKQQAQPHKGYSYLMMVGHACLDMNQSMVPALLPFLVLLRGLDYASAAGLMFASSFFSSLIQPLLGVLSDRRQMPWLMGTGILMTGIGISSIGFLESYWAVFVAVMFAGFGSALFHPEGGRMANCVAGQKKGSGISTFAAGGNLGFVIGPIVVAFLMSSWGLRGTGALLIPALIMAAVFFSMHKTLVRLSDQAKAGVRKEMQATGQKDDWKAFAKLCINIFARSIVNSSMKTFIPLFWVSILIQPHQQASLMITVIALASTVATFFGGRIADRVGFSRTIRFTFVAVCPLVVAIAHVQNVWLATALVVVVAGALNLGHAPSVALGQKYLPNRLGTASGVTLGLAVSVGGICAPLLGRIGSQYGLTVVLYIIAGVAAVGFAGTLLLKDSVVVVQEQAQTTMLKADAASEKQAT